MENLPAYEALFFAVLAVLVILWLIIPGVLPRPTRRRWRHD